MCCGSPTRYKGLTTRALETLHGPLTLISASWWCEHCKSMHYPTWAPMGLPPGSYTWAVGERAAHLGALLPSYARAADSLAYLTGITMSTSEVLLCTVGCGTAYTQPVLAPGTVGPQPDVLYLATDAVMLHFRDTTPWHEVKVFCAWPQTGSTYGPPRYWTADGPWDTHLAAFETLAEWEGLLRARVIVTLGDGSHALWTLLTAIAPHAVQILDWYHVQEHLATVAHLLPEGEIWHKTHREHLRTSQTRAVITDLVHLARDGTSPAIREAARKCAGYLFYHRHRLDYAHAIAHGYPIGSGRIESACKLVVQQRCKGPGMRWTHAQAEAVLHARCAWLNDDWARACQCWRATNVFAAPKENKAAA